MSLITDLIGLIPGGSLTVVLGAIVTLVLAFFGMQRSAKKAGRNEVLAEQRKKDDAVRKEFDKIENQPPNLDNSLDRLRKRSGGVQSKSPK